MTGGAGKVSRVFAKTTEILFQQRKKSLSDVSDESDESTPNRRLSGSTHSRSSFWKSTLFYSSSFFSSKEEEKNEYVLDRLGGINGLSAIVHSHYKRVLADDYLRPYFENVDMRLLKNHQQRFFSMAFTEIPHDYDAERTIISTHQRLFAMGINETHYDRVLLHMEDTLKSRGFTDDIISEAIGKIRPFRRCFQQEIRSELIKNDTDLTKQKSETDL